GGLRAAEDQTGVVLREIALRHLDVETDGERNGRHEDDQGQRPMIEHGVQSAVIETNCAAENRLDLAIDGGGIPTWRPPHEVAADHRRDRQRYDRRDDNGEGKRHRELAKQAADDAAHEQERDESGDQRNRNRYNREADLPRPSQGGGDRPVAALEIAEN